MNSRLGVMACVMSVLIVGGGVSASPDTQQVDSCAKQAANHLIANGTLHSCIGGFGWIACISGSAWVDAPPYASPGYILASVAEQRIEVVAKLAHDGDSTIVQKLVLEAQSCQSEWNADSFKWSAPDTFNAKGVQAWVTSPAPF